MGRAQRLIRTGDDPILKTPCAPVAAGEPLSSLMADMELVCSKLKGVGLAAPQVGVSKRVIYLACMVRGHLRNQFMINPSFLAWSGETEIGEEGCLSFPGIFKQISRWAWVEVRFETSDRAVRQEVFYGFPARVIQHELDHLEGVCKVGDPNYRE